MRIFTFEELDSTNSYAKSNIKNLDDRSVVHALSQTNGRGRLSRKWVDLGKGNLFISFVLKPSEKFESFYPNLTQYLSVCLCKVLESYGVSPEIKWPNDVLINGAKIAGILSETVIESGKLMGIVLGIGVNLNSTKDSLNVIKDKITTSLNIELNKNIDMNEFLSKLTDTFFADYDEFLKYGFEFIKQDYINRNCFLNKQLQVQIFNDIKSGFAKEINNNGELILEENNKDLVLTIGDIL